MHPRVPARTGTRTRRIIGGLSAAVLASGLTAGAVSAPAVAQGDRDLTFVQANIKTASKTFKDDVRTVMAQDPDFISYNEVPFRNGEILAPDGYSLHRSVRNRYTAATPVAWKHPEWTKVDAGTFRISNVRRVPDGKHTKLGLRFANWATLRSVDGRVLSIVSVHVAPLFKIDGKQVDLIRPSVRRLGRLVGRLAPAGPVLVGGDFNVHYKSGRYPRDLFKNAGLVPTYDTMGNYFATGHHRGATIDYIFNRGAGQLKVTSHGRRELHSDHYAVLAGLDWQIDAPARTTEIISDPTGTGAEQYAAVRAVVRTLRRTDPGQSVDVVTGRMAQKRIFRTMRAAVERGVHVRLRTRSRELSRFERRFRRYVSARDAGSSVVRCRDTCQARWRDSGMPRTFALVRSPDGTPRLRLDANRNLTSAMSQRRTRLLLKSGETELAEGERLYRQVS
jgi:endonuclease/exonuclease/phosphatase (EEP) superfamily protein YafD